MKQLCCNCKTRPAVLLRDGLAYCMECHDEQPPLPVSEWDRLARPVTLASLEQRVAAIEQKLATMEADS